MQVGWHPFASCCSLGKMGNASQTGAGRSGSTTEQVLCIFRRQETSDAIRTRFLVHSPPSFTPTTLTTRPAERLLALLCTASAPSSEAHHISAYYRDETIPALPPHWSRLNLSASAVISIRQGCNHSRANLQLTCTTDVCSEIDIPHRSRQWRDTESLQRLCV